MALQLPHSSPPESQVSSDSASVQDDQELGYDDGDIDWETICEESEADRIAGRFYSFEEFKALTFEDFVAMDNMTDDEMHAFIKQRSKD